MSIILLYDTAADASTGRYTVINEPLPHSAPLHRNALTQLISNNDILTKIYEYYKQ